MMMPASSTTSTPVSQLPILALPSLSVQPVSCSRLAEMSRLSEASSESLMAGSINAFGASAVRSEEHTSELQSLMRISYAVFCLKKKNKQTQHIILLNSTNSTAILL